MPIPTEPVSGASIASAWGSSIHNYVYTPTGVVTTGDPVTMLAGEAYRDIPMDITSDPGTWYDPGNDRVIVPSDGAGIYLIVANLISDGGASTGTTQIVLRRNGTEIARGQAVNEGTDDVGITVVGLETLADGDIISLRGRNVGTGTLPSVYLREMTVIRLAVELGIAL